MKLQDKYKLDSQIWKELEEKSYYKQIKKEQFFSRDGDLATEMGFVEKGVLRIYYLDEEGNELNFGFFKEGDIVIADLLPEKKSFFYIEALLDTQLFCVKYCEVEHTDPKIAKLKQLRDELINEKLKSIYTREVYLRSKNASQRYLYFLEQFPGLIDQIPHYHIANYLNISSTQLSRIRKSLQSH